MGGAFCLIRKRFIISTTGWPLGSREIWLHAIQCHSWKCHSVLCHNSWCHKFYVYFTMYQYRMILNLIILICARPNHTVYVHCTLPCEHICTLLIFIWLICTDMYFYGLVCTFMYFTCTLLHQGNIPNCAIQYNQDGTKPFPHTKEMWIFLLLLTAKQGNMDPEPGFGIL